MGYLRKIAPTMTWPIGGRRCDRPAVKLCGFERPERIAGRIVKSTGFCEGRVIENRRTFRPVNIEVGGRYRIVTTVMDVGKLLLDEWPDHRWAWGRAEMAVLDAFNDAVEPEEVRSAFLVAAARPICNIWHKGPGEEIGKAATSAEPGAVWMLGTTPCRLALRVRAC
jgi:hypothetical protein